MRVFTSASVPPSWFITLPRYVKDLTFSRLLSPNCTDRKDEHIIKLPKKGDFSSCENYRGITILSAPGKVFNRIL
jgi:hypothetical protein